MKKLLLTLATVFLAITASAESVTWDFVNQTYGMARQSGNSQVYNPTTVSATNGDSKININGKTRLWADGVRMYSGSNFTVSIADGYEITNIEIYGENGTTLLTSNIALDTNQSGNFSSGKWSGNATSIKFNNTKTSKNIVVGKIVVTYSSTGSQKEDAGLAFPKESYRVNLGEDFPSPELKNPNGLAVTYASENAEVATVDATSGNVKIVRAGTTTISATSKETDEYAAGYASYTLTVIDPNAPAVTINPADLSGLTSNENVTVQGFTFDVEKNNGQTAPTLNGDYRIYAKGSLNIIAPEDLQIVNVVFAISSNGKKRLTSITASEGTIATQDKGDTQVSWSGNANSVTFTVGEKAIYGSDGENKAGQLCFDNVKITYIYKAKKPVVSHNKNQVTITPGEEGAKIYYTVDGSDVDVTKATLYKAPFAITETTTVTAVAVVEGKANSAQHVYKAEYIAAPTATWESKNTTDEHYKFGELNASTMSLDGIHGGIIITITAPEGCALWYSLTQGKANPITKAPAMYANVDNDFESKDIDLKKVDSGKATDILVQKEGKLTYYSENAKGIQSHDVVVNFSGQTGVEDIIADENNGEVEYFNLQGVRVANPENGVYIRRQGNKATKVLVK